MTNRPTDEDAAGDAAAQSLASETAALQQLLRKLHRAVLILLGACALWIVFQGFNDPPSPPDQWILTLGVGLGLGTVILRRVGSSPKRPPQTALFLLMGALLLAGSLGLFGSWIAWSTGATQTGLLFTLAGLIFAIRPSRPNVRVG